MKTELLNQFIFADLLERHAHRINADIPNAPLTKEVLREAYEHLIWLRMETLDIIENSEELEKLNNVIDFKPKT